jgi:hypothetical protein
VIKPTIGRVVLVRNRPGKSGSQDEPALVTYVHSDSLINVGGFDGNGSPFSLAALWLHQGDESDAPSNVHAAWMPYQKGEA